MKPAYTSPEQPDIRRAGRGYSPAFVAYAVTRGLEAGAHQERGMLEWVADALDVSPAWLARKIAGAYRERVIAGRKRRVLVDPVLAPGDRKRFEAWEEARLDAAIEQPCGEQPCGVRAGVSRVRDARTRTTTTRGALAASKGRP